MAQNLTIAGASYNDVPAITVPKQGGGYASFVDTSDGTVVAEDVLADKVCYSNGTRIVGTGTGGGGTKYNCDVEDFLGDTDSSGQLQLVTGNNKDLVLSEVKSLVAYALMYKFYRNGALKSVEFPALTTCSTSSCMNYAFANSTNIVTASFPALTTISASCWSYTFNGCTKLKTVDLSGLESITGTTAMQYAFGGCTALESVDFSSLKVIGNSTTTSTNYRQFYYTFQNCSKLTSLEFPSLEAIYCNGTANNQGTFAYNNKITKIYLPKVTYIGKTSGYSNETAGNNIFYSCSALAEIHFGAENQASIEACTGYATKFGRSAAQIYFDL